MNFHLKTFTEYKYINFIKFSKFSSVYHFSGEVFFFLSGYSSFVLTSESPIDLGPAIFYTCTPLLWMNRHLS